MSGHKTCAPPVLLLFSSPAIKYVTLYYGFHFFARFLHSLHFKIKKLSLTNFCFAEIANTFFLCLMIIYFQYKLLPTPTHNHTSPLPTIPWQNCFTNFPFSKPSDVEHFVSPLNFNPENWKLYWISFPLSSPPNKNLENFMSTPIRLYFFLAK